MGAYRAIALALLAVFLLTACGPSQRAVATGTSLAATQTSTSTPHPSVTPWPTAKPTRTPRRVIPTITPWEYQSPTPGPSITPTFLVPTVDSALRYHLKDWTLESADELTKELQNFIDGLSFEERWSWGNNYYLAYRMINLVQEESFYRFPTAEQDMQRRLDYAFNLAQSGDDRVGTTYTSILADLLNLGMVDLDNLKAGFAKLEPRLRLETIPLDPILGHDQDSLVLLGTGNWRDVIDAGIGLWMFEQGGLYSVYLLPGPLDTAFFYGNGTNLAAHDLTGDGIPEAILEQEDQHGVVIIDDYITVYDLSYIPPLKLDFDPQVNTLEILGWSLSKDNIEITSTRLAQAYCMGRSSGYLWNYRWNGKVLDLTSIELAPDSEFEGDRWPCYGDWVLGLFDEVINGNKAAMQFAPELIALDPIQSRIDEYKALPDNNSYDAIRFLQGIMLYLSGYVDEAKLKLQTIITQPVDPQSSWVESSGLFLKFLETSDNFLDACIASGKCGRLFRIKELLTFIPTGDFSQIIDILSKAGIPIWNHGTYDFNIDGQDEIWLVFSPHADYPENMLFGILYIDGGHINIEDDVIMEQIGEYKSVEINPLPDYDNHLVYQIRVGDNTLTLLCNAYTEYNSPEFQFYVYWRAFENLDDIQADLFAVANPAEVAQRLEDFYTSLMSINLETSKNDLTKYLYLQALAYELSGETGKAVDLYLQLWHTYPDSPYAIMARAKLEPGS